MAEVQARVFETSGGVWAQLRVEAMQAAAEEPLLASYLHASILHHDRIEDALSYHLAQKLGHGDLPALQMREVIRDAYVADPSLGAIAARDMRVVRERDPACTTYLQPFLYFKGYGGLQAYRRRTVPKMTIMGAFTYLLNIVFSHSSDPCFGISPLHSFLDTYKLRTTGRYKVSDTDVISEKPLPTGKPVKPRKPAPSKEEGAKIPVPVALTEQRVREIVREEMAAISRACPTLVRNVNKRNT